MEDEEEAEEEVEECERPHQELVGGGGGVGKGQSLPEFLI